MLDPEVLRQRVADERHKQHEFSKARQLLADLIALPEMQSLFDEEQPDLRRVYSQAPTLVLLVLQRLGGGLSLSAVVQQLLVHHRDLLPKNRRVEEGTLSLNNSAYNKARQQLLLKKVEAFSHAICDHLAAQSEPAWQSRRVVILDGTTITLPPTPELRKMFPPATNQHGESVWPVAMLMVAAKLTTGCVLVPEISAMYGENNSSEVAQAERIIARLPHNALVMADSNFGIFRVAYRCDQLDKEFVFRLSKSRFNALRKKARLVDKQPGHGTWYLRWQPSSKERKSNPTIPRDATIEVFVHEIQLPGEKALYLVSNVEADAESLGALYRRRYDIEFDIRDVKVTMDTENIQAKKLDTVLKELLGSVIAYNLVAQFRRQAARLVGVTPRRLSFTNVWRTFQHQLLYAPPQSFEQWQITYAHALMSAAHYRHPNRPGPRTYPRAALPRRPKSTKFQKAQRKNKPEKPPD